MKKLIRTGMLLGFTVSLLGGSSAVAATEQTQTQSAARCWRSNVSVHIQSAPNTSASHIEPSPVGAGQYFYSPGALCDVVTNAGYYSDCGGGDSWAVVVWAGETGYVAEECLSNV